MASIAAESRGAQPNLIAAAGFFTLRLGWHAIRLPLLTLLVILEPFVRTILMAIAMLGVLITLFYEFVVRLAHFPFWLMLALSIGSALLLLPYYALIRLLSIRSLSRR